ncbi:MAG: aspartate carbamoyltransferase, partial [Pseudomonadota bacterium]|nr:aspartate carbamoyltransferase [Pseudomonadota bacterium]
MSFTGASILSIEQFSLDDVERIFAVADQMQPFANRERVT